MEAIQELESKILARSVLYATCGYFALIALLFWQIHHHYQNTKNFVPDDTLDAELIEQVPKAQLYEKSEAKSAPEATISKKITSSAKSSALEHVFTDKNVTVNQVPPMNNHGPMVEFSPSPKLPEYLKNQNLKTSVLIEFQISQTGQVIPRLLSSSGNEELDVLALKTANTWVIRPAIKDGNPINAKIRLRINFEVN